ncbi:hypothetical protein V1525DRAFT_420304 [Lipomyces kononenkoae]|uniref:Uncharacterized protein n=1 Tax=Lipomyces kononenkoae TaxID=34357 RepID=A0ACC3SY43_LIPKO
MYAYLWPLLFSFSLVSYRFLRRVSDTIIDKALASTPSATSKASQTEPSAGISSVGAGSNGSYTRQPRQLDERQPRRIRVTFQPDGDGLRDVYELVLPEIYPASPPTAIPVAGETLDRPSSRTAPLNPSVPLRSEEEHLRNPIHRHIFQSDDAIHEAQFNQDGTSGSPLAWTSPSSDTPQHTTGVTSRRQSPAMSSRVETSRTTTPKRSPPSTQSGDDNARVPRRRRTNTKPQSDYDHSRQNRSTSPPREFVNQMQDGMGSTTGINGNVPLSTAAYVPPIAIPMQGPVMPAMMPGYVPNHLLPGHLLPPSTFPPIQQPLSTQPMGTAGWVLPGSYPNQLVQPPQQPNALGIGSMTYLTSATPPTIPPVQPQVSPPIPATVASTPVPSNQPQSAQSRCSHCEHDCHYHHYYRSRSPSRSRSRSRDRVVVVSGAPGGGGGGGAGGSGSGSGNGNGNGSGHNGGFGGIWDPLTMYKEQELEKKTISEVHKNEKKKLEDEVKTLKTKADDKNKFISIRNEELKRIWELPISKVKTWHALQEKMVEAFPASAEHLLRDGHYEIRRLEDNVHILPTLWPDVMKESKEYEITLIRPPVPPQPANSKKNKKAPSKNGSFQKWYAEVDKMGQQRRIPG